MMRAPNGNTRARQCGFTMVEMVVGMVVSAILMGMIAMILGAPADRYMEQRRRNELVDASDRITRIVTADLARALPNSVRIRNAGNISVLQMVEVTDTAYYVTEPVAATPAQALEGLNFSNNGDQFTAFGRFDNARGSNQPLLVVGHTGAGTFNVYSPANNIMRATPVPTTPAMAAYPITLNGAFRFRNTSMTNRIFAVRAPITYVCNRGTGRLTRFTDHAFAAAIPANESAAQLTTAGTVVSTIATGITACSITCVAPANSLCQRTVTLSLTLTRNTGANASNLRFLQQAAVENAT